MKITKSSFLDLLTFRKYEEVEAAITAGFDVNTPLLHDRTALEWSSDTLDYRMMEILWKHGAKPSSIITKNVVKAFTAGKTWESFVKEKESEKGPDLTKNFSVKKINFHEGTFTESKGIYSFTFPAEPFNLNKKTVNTNLEIPDVKLPDAIKNMGGKYVSFPVYPKTGYIDASLLLAGAHNRVKVSKITFGKAGKNSVPVTIDAEFLFEDENTGYKNEKATIKTSVSLKKEKAMIVVTKVK